MSPHVMSPHVMSPHDDETPADDPTVPPARWTTTLLVFLLIAVAFAAGAAYIAGEVRASRLETRAAAERADIEHRAAEERAALLARAKVATTDQASELLRMVALPLSWAVRQELQERNFREIALYFQQMVGLRGVERIALVLPDGTVKVASDKKLEGRAAADALPGVLVQQNAPAVRTIDGGALQAVVPIMGLNTRLGALVLDYRPVAIDPSASP